MFKKLEKMLAVSLGDDFLEFNTKSKSKNKRTMLNKKASAKQSVSVSVTSDSL